ncbi:DUF4384 domain-containing protein [bacterium SCSIO 12741]|nr:DUF4384 domain-containing protein [bacterium SCSIO 12741]
MKHGLLLVLLLSTLLASAGKVSKKVLIKNVEAYAVGSESESPAQVKQKALNEAKLLALQKAGVTEQISSYSDFFVKEENGNMEEIFSTNILNDMQGVISDLELLSEEKKINDQGLLEVHIKANIEVIKFKQGMDPSFDLWMDGIKPVYVNKDLLTFTLKPNQEAYIRIFVFAEKQEAYQLYPNEYEKNKVFEAQKEYTFPKPSLDYQLETDLYKEQHRMVVVSLKQDIPFNAKVTYKDIMNWIFQIPPDQRRVTTFSFDVYSSDTSN